MGAQSLTMKCEFDHKTLYMSFNTYYKAAVIKTVWC